MEINRAKEIISALAEGVDPTTGEILPEDSVCNKGEVVRAFYTVLASLDTPKPKKTQPKNASKHWTKEEDEQLKELYNNGLSKRYISNMFGRTTGSISSRLRRLGLISD